MSEIKDKYICTCCGGRITPTTMRCEYCGTQYREERGDFLRIETFVNPVRTFVSKRNVTDDMFRGWSTSEVAEYVLKDMADELGHIIMPMIEVRANRDPFTKSTNITTTIKVVEPVNKGGLYE